MAGNRIVDDPRNSLYKELIEIVGELQPNFVICENVKGLRTMLGGLVEKKIIADFKEIGYDMMGELRDIDFTVDASLGLLTINVKDWNQTYDVNIEF